MLYSPRWDTRHKSPPTSGCFKILQDIQHVQVLHRWKVVVGWTGVVDRDGVVWNGHQGRSRGRVERGRRGLINLHNWNWKNSERWETAENSGEWFIVAFDAGKYAGELLTTWNAPPHLIKYANTPSFLSFLISLLSFVARLTQNETVCKLL